MLNHHYDKEHIHSFTHEAMATVYEIMIKLDDKSYASQAAQEAFSELDRLENELSRFRPNSDICKINSLAPDETLILGDDAWNCLEQTMMIHQLTSGMFDITKGGFVLDNKFQENNIETGSEIIYGGLNKIQLHKNKHSVSILEKSVQIDLGGFGKGYAIDKVYKQLLEWDINNFMIHGGGSSVKTCGSPDSSLSGWPLTLSNPSNPSQTLMEIKLKNNSVSASGLKKGNHIINPLTGEPVTGRNASWVMTESAGLSDALSTAFMLMPKEKISELCKNDKDISGIIIKSEQKNIEKDDLFVYGEQMKEIILK